VGFAMPFDTLSQALETRFGPGSFTTSVFRDNHGLS
jgi:hypothetical protein